MQEKTQKQLEKYDEKYWEKRIDPSVPERVKNAIKRVYESYPKDCLPQGVCDPMYIMNVIAKELGIGNGQGEFNYRPRPHCCYYNCENVATHVYLTGDYYYCDTCMKAEKVLHGTSDSSFIKLDWELYPYDGHKA